MGNLAIALKQRGWRVSGSDRTFYSPMSDALVQAQIETKLGWDAQNITADIDTVVVGNVCRADNPEVLAAEALGLKRTTLPDLVAREFIGTRPAVAVCGTHGKSTTTALLAWLLKDAGQQPGHLIAALANNFERSLDLGASEAPFVVEADEYDTAFFEKTPKFWHYGATHAIWTSIEYDHADIYPDEQAYLQAFVGLLARLPEDGVIAAYAGDAKVREVLADARQRVIWYAVDGDPVGSISPTWMAAPTAHQPAPASRSLLALAPQQPPALQSFDLFTAGTFCGRFSAPLLGTHNLRNSLACLAMATEVYGAPLRGAIESLGRFRGLARRQQWLASVDGVDLFDDFAHHPTAVRETLRAFRRHFPDRRLIAVFEPRSATACSAVHQQAYVEAFSAADQVHLAPLGRTQVADPLDLRRLAHEIATSSPRSEAAAGRVVACHHDALEGLEETLMSLLEVGDVVVFMSNGSFGEVPKRVATALKNRPR